MGKTSIVADTRLRRRAQSETTGPRRGDIKRIVRHLVGSLAMTAGGARLMRIALRDDRVMEAVMLHLSDRVTKEASFDVLTPDPAGVRGVYDFHELAWLFSWNPLNHGLSRVELGEAAHLYGLVRSLERPRVAEIGRYRGGTTFLLAAAGGEVLSIDNDEEREERDSPALRRALGRFGLEGRVTAEVADSQSYPAGVERFDVVFIDGDHTYDGVSADIRTWWPAVRSEGHLLLDDADRRYPWVEGVARAVEELDGRADARRVPAPGSLAHFIKAHY